MKVVIVAKTRQGSRACIGGLTFEGQSVRLLAADAAVNTHANQDYQVGEVWDVSGAPAEQIVPPHVENFVVHARRRLGVISDCVTLIQRHLPIADGSWQEIFNSDANVYGGSGLINDRRIDAANGGLTAVLPANSVIVLERVA